MFKGCASHMFEVCTRPMFEVRAVGGAPCLRDVQAPCLSAVRASCLRNVLWEKPHFEGRARPMFECRHVEPQRMQGRQQVGHLLHPRLPEHVYGQQEVGQSLYWLHNCSGSTIVARACVRSALGRSIAASTHPEYGQEGGGCYCHYRA